MRGLRGSNFGNKYFHNSFKWQIIGTIAWMVFEPYCSQLDTIVNIITEWVFRNQWRFIQHQYIFQFIPNFIFQIFKCEVSTSQKKKMKKNLLDKRIIYGLVQESRNNCLKRHSTTSFLRIKDSRMSLTWCSLVQI